MDNYQEFLKTKIELVIYLIGFPGCGEKGCSNWAAYQVQIGKRAHCYCQNHANMAISRAEMSHRTVHVGELKLYGMESEVNLAAQNEA